MLARISSLGPRGVRAILWHQGESDTHRKPEQQLSADQYTATMEKVIRVSRERAGWAIPWFTAQATYWGPDRPAFPSIREAQARLWKPGLALEGPDTDSLTGEVRQSKGKGVHFSATGLVEHGRLWAAKVSAWLDTQLR